MEENSDKRKKAGKKDIITVIILFAVLCILYLVFSRFETQVDDYLNSLAVRLNLSVWLAPIICWIIGLVAWLITYIGARIASKKSGRFVSGIPGVAFVSFIFAGLLSPYKYLALLAVVDYEIIMLPIEWIVKKNKKNN